MDLIRTSFGYDLGIFWASFGHHLGIIWASFRNHLEMIQGSFRRHMGIMFREFKVGGSGGRSPLGKQGAWGAAGPPMSGLGVVVCELLTLAANGLFFLSQLLTFQSKFFFLLSLVFGSARTVALKTSPIPTWLLLLLTFILTLRSKTHV